MQSELLLLGVIGILLTIIGFGIAFHIGSKLNKPKVELTEVQKSLKDLHNLNGKDD